MMALRNPMLRARAKVKASFAATAAAKAKREETQGGEKFIVLPSDVRLRVEQYNMIEEAKRSLETVPSF